MKISKKTVIIIIAAVLVVAIATLALVSLGGDFRRAKWGMSPEKIKAREDGEIIVDSSYRLSYKVDNLEGVPVETNVFYNFDGANGLWQVSMGYDMEGYEDKLADKIIKAFEKKYGEADEYEETMTAYEYYWKNDRTEIRISQQQTYMLITFTDINYVIED
ncbi:MAG: hypothetical protein IKT39_06910 [Clostridia bacterium]|nr:hypothetical protein [Clostridia bacterium]